MSLPFSVFRRASVTCLASLVLVACTAGQPWDFDFRSNGPRADVTVADRPTPDSRGVISYDSYQVAIAQRGDTVNDIAGRLGLSGPELAEFNGRIQDEVLRGGEVLALPRRVAAAPTPPITTSPAPQRDIASIAQNAIDTADQRGTIGSGNVAPQTSSPQVQTLPDIASATQPEPATPAAPAAPTAQEPVRHQIGRGETAYSVARLYGVSVRSLAEWNGLGPDLAVREGQYLLIPVIIQNAPPSSTTPGQSVAPAPPSAANPMPDGVQAQTPPSLSNTGTGTATPAPQAPASRPQEQASSRLARPVEGSILRGFSDSNEGIDISASTGTPVRAAANGTVAAITQNTDQVPILVIRHADGLLTVYANIQNVRVSRGDNVSRGQTIAEVGSGDPSFLHFEVRRGFEAMDPNEYLP